MRWLKLLVVIAVALVIAMFTVQNMARTVPLSLDFGFVAWRLRDPVPASILVWLAFGAGVLVGGVPALVRAARLNRRVRQLEQEVAVASAGPAKKEGWG